MPDIALKDLLQNGFGDLEEVFNSFFGGGFGGFGGGRRQDPNAPQRGDDLRLDIEIEFEEAVFGLNKEIKIGHLETCTTCKGTGARKGKASNMPALRRKRKCSADNQNRIRSFYSNCHDVHIAMVKVQLFLILVLIAKGDGRKEVEKKIDIKNTRRC